MDILMMMSLVVLVFSIIVHEVSHGYMAKLLGDPTAQLQGRLTLNPIKHIDPIGSVLLPALLVFTHSQFLFGWAKPVPYNPHLLTKGGRFAEALVALAGPLSNIALAVLLASLYKLGLINSIVAYIAVYTNIFLALLNLIPIPPLDGSKILPSLLPAFLRFGFENMMRQMEMGGIMTMVFVLIFLSYFAITPLTTVTNTISSALLGV